MFSLVPAYEKIVGELSLCLNQNQKLKFLWNFIKSIRGGKAEKVSIIMYRGIRKFHPWAQLNLSVTRLSHF